MRIAKSNRRSFDSSLRRLAQDDIVKGNRKSFDFAGRAKRGLLRSG
jgi:hypothetical protein